MQQKIKMSKIVEGDDRSNDRNTSQSLERGQGTQESQEFIFKNFIQMYA